MACAIIGLCTVAPFAGAWIEITLMKSGKSCIKSLPSRERGLKCSISLDLQDRGLVAPFAGAWIEIEKAKVQAKAQAGRSLRGSVD